MIRTWLASLGLLVLAATASAGPIPWSVNARVRTETGTGVLKVGAEPLTYDPTGNGQDDTPVTRDFVFTTPLPEFSASSMGEGTGEVRLFSLPYSSPRVDTWFAEDAPASDDRFFMTLDLRDDRTGDTGRIEYAGRIGAASSGQYPAYFLFSLSLDPAVSELTLGGTRYRVEALGGLPDEIDEPAGAWLRITPNAGPINTPEPGTLLLAGVGVGTLLMRRRYR